MGVEHWLGRNIDSLTPLCVDSLWGMPEEGLAEGEGKRLVPRVGRVCSLNGRGLFPEWVELVP